MKKLFLLLPLLALLYACDSGSGASAGKDTNLTTSQDSMYYAFGSSIVTGMDLEGLKWNAGEFEKGLNDQMAGSASLETTAAMQQIQAFGQEAQSRQGRPITAEDGLTVNMDDVSYAYGIYFISQLKEIGMDISVDALAGGFADANAGKNKLGDEAAIQKYSNMFNQAANEKARAAQEAKSQAEAGPNKEAGAAFMEANKEKEGVLQHESGMQYKVLKKGTTGGASPVIADKVIIHYEGRLLDGTVFDSSYKRGEKANFPLGNLIKGWQIALPMMKPGDKWTIWLPSDIAYGDAGSPPNIPPGATLEFDIEYFGIGE